jgi:hypothetical protein
MLSFLIMLGLLLIMAGLARTPPSWDIAMKKSKKHKWQGKDEYKPRNPFATQETSGSGFHSKRKYSRKQKHKNKDY